MKDSEGEGPHGSDQLVVKRRRHKDSVLRPHVLINSVFDDILRPAAVTPKVSSFSLPRGQLRVVVPSD